jgi:hypothetical protein
MDAGRSAEAFSQPSPRRNPVIRPPSRDRRTDARESAQFSPLDPHPLKHSKFLKSLKSLKFLKFLKFLLISKLAFQPIKTACLRSEHFPLFLVLLFSPVQGAAVASNASAALAGENPEQDEDHENQDQNPGQRIEQSTFHCFPPFDAAFMKPDAPEPSTSLSFTMAIPYIIN